MRTRGRWALGLMGFYVALVVGRAEGAAVPVFSTGVDSEGNLLADGAADPHYALTVNPEGGTGPYVTDEAGYPFVNPAHPNTAWVADLSASKWISPEASYTSSSDDVSGDYTYETTFSMAGLNAGTASISGEFSVDDNLLDILLNGVSTGISGTSQTGFTTFTINSGFVAGMNTLDFEVSNKVQANGNVTGIQVEMTGSALAVPEPGTLLLLPMGLLLMGRGFAGRRIRFN